MQYSIDTDSDAIRPKRGKIVPLVLPFADLEIGHALVLTDPDRYVLARVQAGRYAAKTPGWRCMSWTDEQGALRIKRLA